MKKCDVKDCLNEEKGDCTIDIPSLILLVKPGSRNCKYYETKEIMLEILKKKKTRFKSESKSSKKRKNNKDL